MNKTESLETLKRRLDDAERKLADQALELAVLRKTIEAPEPAEKKPLLDHDFVADMVYPGNPHIGSTVSGAYANAINTLLDLRRQPGSEAAVDGKEQWFIDANGEIVRWRTDLKMSLLCPPFDSHDSALAAKEAVGWGRIKKMMDTLHGRGYEVL